MAHWVGLYSAGKFTHLRHDHIVRFQAFDDADKNIVVLANRVGKVTRVGDAAIGVQGGQNSGLQIGRRRGRRHPVSNATQLDFLQLQMLASARNCALINVGMAVHVQLQYFLTPLPKALLKGQTSCLQSVIDPFTEKYTIRLQRASAAGNHKNRGSPRFLVCCTF